VPTKEELLQKQQQEAVKLKMDSIKADSIKQDSIKKAAPTGVQKIKNGEKEKSTRVINCNDQYCIAK
jgi:peroxiredoxin family protein